MPCFSFFETVGNTMCCPLIFFDSISSQVISGFDLFSLTEGFVVISVGDLIIIIKFDYPFNLVYFAIFEYLCILLGFVFSWYTNF